MSDESGEEENYTHDKRCILVLGGTNFMGKSLLYRLTS
jgi:hypothetical protein